MTKNYFYQVKLIQNLYLLWCGFFAYFIFGNSAIVRKLSGFLHIINLSINKNMYYENKLQKKS